MIQPGWLSRRESSHPRCGHLFHRRVVSAVMSPVRRTDVFALAAIFAPSRRNAQS